MKNEKGITLVELLAVLVIIGIVITMIGAIMTSSMKTSQRATIEQRLQQEANYITEAIRNEYLKRETASIEVAIVDVNGKEQLQMDGQVISEGYLYTFQEDVTKSSIELKRTDKKSSFSLKLKSKAGHFYIIDTSFSKLH